MPVSRAISSAGARRCRISKRSSEPLLPGITEAPVVPPPLRDEAIEGSQADRNESQDRPLCERRFACELAAAVGVPGAFDMSVIETEEVARLPRPARRAKIDPSCPVRVQGKFFFVGDRKHFIKGVTYGPFPTG